MILKHFDKINSMKWNKRIIKGFFIILSGTVEIENHEGWNGFLLTSGDYFG
jgi:hypothetical protein